MNSGLNAQPVSRVEWVKRDQLRANAYNPNHQAPPEFELLKVSLLADGWTQPIVARRDGEIVDGFHRWKLSADSEVAALTGGLVPVVYIEDVEPGHQMMSTIRHNRARGNHGALKMADIVRRLRDDQGMTPEAIQTLLGMEDEEFERLYDASGMPSRGGAEGFGKGWVPTEA